MNLKLKDYELYKTHKLTDFVTLFINCFQLSFRVTVYIITLHGKETHFLCQKRVLEP